MATWFVYDPEVHVNSEVLSCDIRFYGHIVPQLCPQNRCSPFQISILANSEISKAMYIRESGIPPYVVTNFLGVLGKFLPRASPARKKGAPKFIAYDAEGF